MAGITFRCSNCEKDVSVSAELEGLGVECPHCGAEVMAGSGAIVSVPGAKSQPAVGRAAETARMLSSYPGGLLLLLKVMALLLAVAAVFALPITLILSKGYSVSLRGVLIAIGIAVSVIPILLALIHIVLGVYSISRRLDALEKARGADTE